MHPPNVKWAKVCNYLLIAISCLLQARFVREANANYKNDEPDAQKFFQQTDHLYDTPMVRNLDLGLNMVSEDEERLRLALLVEENIDTNHDQVVQLDELVQFLRKAQNKFTHADIESQWIGLKKSVHKEGEHLEWKTYVAHEYNHLEQFSNQIRSHGEKKAKLDQFYHKQIHKDLRRWKLADLNGDGRLSFDEFGAFLHPENHPHMHPFLVEEELERIDKDEDKLVSMDEFVAELKTRITKQLNQKEEADWLSSERRKFVEKFDSNKDKYLDKQELSNWMSRFELNDHTVSEAQHLFLESDTNKDLRLTKEEILAAYPLFVESHVTDFGEALKGIRPLGRDEL